MIDEERLRMFASSHWEQEQKSSSDWDDEKELDTIKTKAALDDDIEKSITSLIEEVSKEFIKSEWL